MEDEGMAFTVAVKRRFFARHYLVGGDWGVENEPHTHRYGVEVRLEAAGLNEQGFVVDLVVLKERLDAILAAIRDRTLNELAPFAGLNPSSERLAAAICRSLSAGALPGVTAVAVRVSEDDDAWAACRLQIAPSPESATG